MTDQVETIPSQLRDILTEQQLGETIKTKIGEFISLVKTDEEHFVENMKAIAYIIKNHDEAISPEHYLDIVDLMRCPEGIDPSIAYHFIDLHKSDIGRQYKEANNLLLWESPLSQPMCSLASCPEDVAWAVYIEAYGDIYRYHSLEIPDDQKITAIKDALQYAAQAYSQLSDKDDYKDAYDYNPDMKERVGAYLSLAFCDGEVGDIQQAQEISEYIGGNPHLKTMIDNEIALETQRKSEGRTLAWKKVERIKKKSLTEHVYIEQLLKFADRQVPVTEVEKEAIDVGKTMTVAINTNLDSLEKILDSREYYSLFSFGPYDRHTYMLGSQDIIKTAPLSDMTNKQRTNAYLNVVRHACKSSGIMAKGTSQDPFPIYGAAYYEQIDAKRGGALHYGRAAIILKQEDIRDRTTFTDDDSGNMAGGFPTDFDHGVYMKATHNLAFDDRQATVWHGYIEAQVHGGVKTDVIEKILYTLSTQPNVREQELQIIQRIQEKYPNIPIVIS